MANQNQGNGKDIPGDRTMADLEGSSSKSGHIGPGSAGNPVRAAESRPDGTTVTQPAGREVGGSAAGTGGKPSPRNVSDTVGNTGVGNATMPTAEATPEKMQGHQQKK